MSTHRECGADIEWPRREDDPERFGRPLEYAGPAYILTEEGYAIRVLTYRQHECDPDVMEAWIERCRRIEELSYEAPAYETAYEVKKQDRANEAWDIALRVSCRTCLAKKNKKCTSLHKHDKGRILKNPHAGRLEDGQDSLSS